MNKRYQQCFDALRQKNEGAFVPFVMLGDPDLETSYQILIRLIENGADALELGIPFSDPIADGPVIQKAAIRALENGATVTKCFELIASIRKDYPDIPMGLLVYSNLVVGNSVEVFYQQASNAGVDSVLIADVPIIESARFVEVAKKNNIAPIFIATPNADDLTLEQVAKLSEGYTYLLSRSGVTGTDVKAEMPVDGIISKLKQFNAPPSLLGFGISAPTQVKQAIVSGSDGAISGSAVVKIIDENLDNTEQMLEQLSSFIHDMKQATKV
ncbi:tryptophan synthase subunit alpha [Aliikangiella coralliicola]|uniref:Tryptophan synthase alpha chain n=1 Tax=Aliikangiella coralliicola TaxID=2592383 RepID=A0A545TWI7_9GAMM|nr:tryptophan synthase subunit alpha [Aliikangiella coralliicola]TQV81541.1 tryptophan synthase subunit alpha [Aliikangiella coralliicola]